MNYFESKKIADGTWRITNDFKRPDTLVVYSYLIEGENYALLIDTMFGFGNLKAYCETLTDKPIKLVNTHVHGDHTGGNFHFDACYIGTRDVAPFMNSIGRTKEQVFEQAKSMAREECIPEMKAEDFADEKPIKVYPVDDGDVFDLGDREIEVVEVPGHTRGSIVLIDHKTRICFNGDACNRNTLLQFKGGSTTIEEYMESLLYYKKFVPDFDIIYAGHDLLEPSIIDEGIELVGRVLAGTDDHEIRPSFMGGGTVVYGAKHVGNTMAREDGKLFNICYDPNNLLFEGEDPQVIK